MEATPFTGLVGVQAFPFLGRQVAPSDCSADTLMQPCPSEVFVFAVSRTVVVLSVAALSLTGCAAGSGGTPTPTPTPAASAIDNCGVSVPITSPPQRVVTIKSTSTEMLLALGLGDRIVGTAFQDGPVPARWSADAASLPVLADKVPSQEVVLSATPDFVYAGWESNFSADGAGTRSDLAALGIRSYVSPSACKEAAYQPSKLSFSDIDAEINQVAEIFSVDDSTLLANQHATLAGVAKDTRGLSALWFSSGSSVPYIGAGIGAPQLILDTIGVRNIAGDIKDTWAPYNWESVIAANPDVIVLVDASWSTKEKKIKVLEDNPATAKLDAVKNHRYLVVPFAASEAGVRTVDAAEDLAQQLKAQTFG
ncbi:MAG: putative F420-0 ABC transporter substrate-binding protein [Terrimesophilobacter sp.]